MLKFFTVAFSSLFLVSCQPIESKSLLRVDPLSPHCLSSQNTCLIASDIAEISIEFSQAIIDEKSLRFSDKNIFSELDFDVIVAINQRKSTTNKIKSVTGFFEGVNMFMGKIPSLFSSATVEQVAALNLARDKSDVVEDYFISKGILANCAEETMTWRLWLTLEFEHLDNDAAVSDKKVVFIDFTAQRL